MELQLKAAVVLVFVVVICWLKVTSVIRNEWFILFLSHGFDDILGNIVLNFVCLYCCFDCVVNKLTIYVFLIFIENVFSLFYVSFFINVYSVYDLLQ